MELKEGYKQTEVGVIPEDWEVLKISEITREISMGPFGSDIKVSNFVRTGVPVLSGRNVAKEKLHDEFHNFVTPKKAHSLKKAVAKRGDIVVTHRGTIGQIAYIPLDSKYESYVISQSQFRLRVDERKSLPEWVVLYFLSDEGSRRLLEKKGHTGVPAIAQATTTFRGLSLPVPPVVEQEAIAKLLSDADALIESLEQLIAKKRQIKQGAMQELLTGKRRLPGFENDLGYKQTEVGLIPEDWIYYSVRKMVDSGLLEKPLDGNHGNIHPTSGDFVDYGIPFVMANNVQNGKVDLENCSFIRKSQADSLQKGFAKTGDVLLTHKATIGNTAVVGKIPFPYIMLTPQVTYYRVADRSLLSNLYLRHFFDTAIFQEVLNIKAGGGTRSYIGITSQFQLPIILPPTKTEQEAIATILSDMDAEIAALETKLSKAQQVKQGMMQELLTGKTRLVDNEC